jgi:hypothetical protein
MDYKNYFDESVDYLTYQNEFITKSNNPSAYNFGEYIPMNQHRSARIDRTFELSEEQNHIAKATTNRTWLVISEHWCGDASQIIPVMNKIAEASEGKINFRLVYRDEVPDLMNAHLTNGGMAVPKIIQLDEHFELFNDWGPRPKAAQEMVIKLKSDPETAANYIEELHKWYAHDKQKSTVAELLDLLR